MKPSSTYMYGIAGGAGKRCKPRGQAAHRPRLVAALLAPIGACCAALPAAHWESAALLGAAHGGAANQVAAGSRDERSAAHGALCARADLRCAAPLRLEAPAHLDLGGCLLVLVHKGLHDRPQVAHGAVPVIWCWLRSRPGAVLCAYFNISIPRKKPRWDPPQLEASLRGLSLAAAFSPASSNMP